MVRGGRPPPSGEAVLARVGMSADTAVPALRALGVWDDRPSAEVWPIVEALASSSNPDQSLRSLVRLVERSPEGWAALVAGETADGPGPVARAALVAGASEPLGDLVAADPAALRILSGDLHPWDPDQVAARCREEMAGSDEPAAAMALEQRRGLLRVAARDLLGWAGTDVIAGELAALADGVLSAAFDQVAARNLERGGRVAIIAMGKLGGRELNYVSDVDVIFVAGGDWASANKTCERFLRLCNKTTREGRAYEVDANLRPEGRDGPLVRSLESYGAYYERWARTWEFQALLKARPIAGDADLGAGFMGLIEPYVWPDRLAGSAVAEIQQMKGTVEQTREVQRAGARQVKLAPGGLRDIEFAVQLLQLVHGRHDRSLRSPNTLEALASLAEGGYVARDDAADFRRAYLFLRTVEHRLQLARLRRTHVIPEDAEARARVARAMGMRGQSGQSALELFDAEVRRVQGTVRGLHEKLFYRPLLSRFAELGRDAQLALMGGDDSAGGARLAGEAAQERLAALGFRNAEGALRDLDALASGVSRRAKLLRNILPALLPTLAEAPDPDGGLAAFRSLAERLESSPLFLKTLRDSPPVGDLLAGVLGRSRLVGEWLERQPEVFGLLADLDGLARTLTGEAYRRVARGLVARGQAAEDAADALRRFKRREALRTAVRDLSGAAGFEDVAAELTGLAEACLEAGLTVAHEEAGAAPDPDRGPGRGGGMRVAVIGMGTLGGAELTYASDLDILLVHEGGEGTGLPAQVAERLLRHLSAITPEGQAFLVDPNLRPEGKDGPLSRTLDSYRRYYERWVQTWELQALTQSRVVAGDRELGRRFLALVQEVVYQDPPQAKRMQEIRRMKARVERERAGRPQQRRPIAAARPRPGGLRKATGAPGGQRSSSGRWVGDRVDLKLGRGGMSDVEWTVQLLQMRHGGADPGLRLPGTLGGIAALADAGLLGAEEAVWLRDGYRLLARIRNALYLAGYRDSSVLPPGVRDQERIARMLGFAPPWAQALMEEVGRVTRRVRKVHERRFYEA